MHKGGRPCGKSAATLNREREQEEKANPEKRQRRLEDDDCKKINFFAGHTPGTLFPVQLFLTVKLFLSTRVCLITMIVWKTGCVAVRKVRSLCVGVSCCVPH